MLRILVTGFPGFLATRLIPEVLLGPDGDADEPGPRTALCIVEPRMAEAALRSRASLEAHHPALAGRIHLVEGDLTRPGILAPGEDPGPVDRAYHLAAAYTLDVGRERARAVNVEGTRHLLALLDRKAPRLDCLHHVSTCYVSGRHRGIFREDDLDVGQRFGNHYEETKFLAEVEVRKAAGRGMPVAVHRPSIVTGDSRTGAAEKLDGLYYLLQWIRAQGPVALLPRVPGQAGTVFNVVPSDFVVAALARLSERPDAPGRTFHLADPDPLPVVEVARRAAAALGSRLLRVPVPMTVAKAGLLATRVVPGFPRIPAQALDYLAHPTRYGTGATLPLLEEAGLRAPPLPAYLPALVRFLEGSGRAQPSAPSPAPEGAGGRASGHGGGARPRTRE